MIEAPVLEKAGISDDMFGVDRGKLCGLAGEYRLEDRKWIVYDTYAWARVLPRHSQGG
ncbi:hypothetical protein PABY_10920 [Pyrodictium abyssi]|uniref:Uncharacterized protein n=1 Tax=Pyrodictium abyssi TaxID=54256 RepID=A0ABN6ZMM0_9CREN|nr:hypothetical protein PABY_10920 [Pyrodictium abyssi]